MSAAPQQFIYTEALYKLPQKTIVLFHVPWETVSEEHKALLNKILSSVRLSTAAVQIVCCEKIDLSQLQVFDPSVVISFGVAVNPTTELYTSSEAQGIRIIQSDTLEALNDANKKSLWGALKATFA